MCCECKINFNLSGRACSLYEVCVRVCALYLLHFYYAYYTDVFVCVTLPRRVIIDKVIMTANSTAEPSGKATQVCVCEKERDR